MATKGERTKERILQAAIRLFSESGVQGTSVRTIAKELGMNEASLYNHFSGKEELYNEILRRFSDRLLEAGLAAPEVRQMDLSKSLFELLKEDAERFFSRTRNEEATAMWRILMMEQYRHRETADFVRHGVLAAPEHHLRALLEELKGLGKIRAEVAVEPTARALAALFFHYSFAANLALYWESDGEGLWPELEESLRSYSRLLEA